MSKFVTAAIAALSLSACALPEATDDEMQLAVFAAVESSWHAYDMGVPDADCNLERFQVIHASAPKFKQLCGVESTQAYGCSHTEQLYPLRAGSIPMVVVSPIHYIEPHIIVHELLHHFLRCTVGRDFNHSNPKVWTAVGGPATVEGRAIDLLMDGGWL